MFKELTRGGSLALFVAMTGCAAEPRLELRTGSAMSEVELHDVSILVPFSLPASGSDKEVASGFSMKLRATVRPPMVDGETVQATDVYWHGNRVVAVYNFRGSTDKGAMQLIDVSNPAKPELVIEAIYPRTDLNRVALQGSRVVVAAADQELGATLEHFELNGYTLTYDDFTLLPSYSATYVEIDGGGRAMVTYGDDGGAARYDLQHDPFNPTSEVSIPDARWIGADGKDLLVVAGSPARIERHKNGLGGPVTTRLIPGASVGAPTWALVEKGVLYIAADTGGVLLFDAKTLAPISDIQLGGDTNGLALTSDRRILFVAGGDAGLVAVDVDDNKHPVVLQSIDVPDSGSANAVAIHAKSLALADGLGGVKLLTFERNQGNDYDPEDLDGDLVANVADLDDDDDGVLDADDRAPADPDAFCAPGELIAVAGALAEVFELGCDHPDVGPGARPRSTGTLPTDFDWFAPSRRVRSIAASTMFAPGPADHGVAAGSCGEAYVATRWKTTAIAAAGSHRLRLTATDDAWLFVDGQLVHELGGAHGTGTREAEVSLAAGAHAIELYAVRRHAGAAETSLSVVGGPGLELGQRACLAPGGDDDRDGILNIDDVAPLVPKLR